MTKLYRHFESFLDVYLFNAAVGVGIRSSDFETRRVVKQEKKGGGITVMYLLSALA